MVKHSELRRRHEMSDGKDDDMMANQSDGDVIDQIKMFEDQLTSHIDALSDDIDDFMDENPVSDAAGSADELEKIVCHMEKLRSGYRSKHKELEKLMGMNYQNIHGSAYHEKLNTIKLFVKKAQSEKKRLRAGEAS